MSKEFDTKSNPSNCEVEAVRLVAGQKYTTGRRFRKIALTTLVFLLVFCLGFILSELRCRDPMDGIHFYVYDTEQKVEDYWKESKKAFFDRTGLSPESPEAQKYMAKGRNGWRPLVEVGPFFIFLFEDGDRRWFTVIEMPSQVLLAQLASDEQSKELRLFSSLEKGWKFPRFRYDFRYSKDGIYADGVFSVLREDMTPERVYFDTQGIGVFDAMYIYENDEQFTYYLNGLSWEPANEQPLTAPVQRLTAEPKTEDTTSKPEEK
jgi:hypothetical protein